MTAITPIEGMRQLAELFQEWHRIRVRELERIVQADEDTVIQTEDGPLALQGDTLLAFRTGVHLCLKLFSKSPLVEIPNSPRQGNYVH